MDYNPYDLVYINLNGHHTFGRPVTFDSEIVDHFNLKNASGKYIKPTQISTTCPDCGQGFILDVYLKEPPFDEYECSCPYCSIVPIMPDPFINPIIANKIELNELDPLLHNINKPLTLSSTVSDRTNVETIEMHPDIYINPSKKCKKKKKKPEKSVKQEQKPEQPVINDFIEYNDVNRLEPAEGMGFEDDFDDNDLIEQ